MLLYNITIAVDAPIEQEWKDWMKKEFIPECMKTGLFKDFRFYKVLTHDDPASASYCVQYFVETIEQFNQYLNVHAQALLEQQRLKFPDRHAAFQTLLEEIS
ncbi:MAG: DUF4286 family protein [Cyclobacteriaceae bacterium]